MGKKGIGIEVVPGNQFFAKKWFSDALKYTLFFFFLLLPMVAFGQAETEARLEAVEVARRQGLVGLAEGLLGEVLESGELSGKAKNDALLDMVTFLIAQQNFTEAELYLQKIAFGELKDPIYLRLALIALATGNDLRAKTYVSKLTESACSPQDRPWYFLLQALLQGDKQLEHFAKLALAACTNQTQKQVFETLFSRERILQESFKPEYLQKLKEKSVSEAIPVKEKYLFLKQYLFVLYKLGRYQEILDVIGSTLKNAKDFDPTMVSELNLLQATLMDETGRDSSLLFQSILSNAKLDAAILKRALAYIVHSKYFATHEESLLAFINSLIDSQHPLTGELLYAKALLLVKKGQWESAEALCQQILSTGTYSQSENRQKMDYFLAYCSLNKSPAQYRTAADCFQNARKSTPENTYLHAKLGRLIADCYFLNGDFEIALRFYEETLRNPTLSDKQVQAVAYQIILTLLQLDRIERANAFLEKGFLGTHVQQIHYWRAFYAVVKSLMGKGLFKEASEKIEKVFKDNSKDVPLEEFLKLSYVRAEIAFENKQWSSVMSLIDNIVSSLTLPAAISLTAKRQDAIRAKALFLKAKVLLQQQKEQEASMLLETLRAQYPKSPVVPQSYVDEAIWYENKAHYVKAQQILVQMVDQFPSHELAPIALYKAAINASQRGKDYLNEAVALIEKLAKQYSQSPLIYYARLKQGDWLREVGDFSAAEKLYDQLLKQSTNVQNSQYLEFLKIKCVLAQEVDVQTQTRCATIENLERFFKTQPLSEDFHLEVGFFLGYTLEKTEPAKDKEVKALYWELIAPYIADKKPIALGSTGVYWLTRLILELADLLEKGDDGPSAEKLYHFILDHQLPAELIAKSKLEQFKK